MTGITRRLQAAAISVPSALVFAWAGGALPTTIGSWTTAWLLLLSLLHGVTAACAWGRPRTLPCALRLLALASLLGAVLFAGALLLTGSELVERYGSLGWGLSALLALIGVLALAGTLPVGLWALRESGREGERA